MPPKLDAMRPAAEMEKTVDDQTSSLFKFSLKVTNKFKITLPLFETKKPQLTNSNLSMSF